MEKQIEIDVTSSWWQDEKRKIKISFSEKKKKKEIRQLNAKTKIIFEVVQCSALYANEIDPKTENRRDMHMNVFSFLFGLIFVQFEFDRRFRCMDTCNVRINNNSIARITKFWKRINLVCRKSNSVRHRPIEHWTVDG